MRRKGERSIPDFSRKKKAPPRGTEAQPEAQRKVPPPPMPRTIKPQSTSSKSGRRGQ
jgi:hypothetical protein